MWWQKLEEHSVHMLCIVTLHWLFDRNSSWSSKCNSTVVRMILLLDSLLGKGKYQKQQQRKDCSLQCPLAEMPGSLFACWRDYFIKQIWRVYYIWILTRCLCFRFGDWSLVENTGQEHFFGTGVGGSAMPTRDNQEEGPLRHQKSPEQRIRPPPGPDYTQTNTFRQT